MTKKKPYIRKPWERERVSISEFDESRTVMADAQETDINHIVARFARTGKLPPGAEGAQYADVSGLNEDLTVLLQKQQEINQRIADYEQQREADRAAAAATTTQDVESATGTEVDGGSQEPAPTAS